MIVVDTNVIASATLRGPLREAAEAALLKDRAWAAPRLWRHEMRSVLRQQMRSAGMSRADAVKAFDRAASLLGRREHDVNTAEVLDLAARSGCTTYDCEFVAAALAFDIRLVTNDRQVLRAFPVLAVPLEVFAAGG